MNNVKINNIGICLKGYVRTNYDFLVEKLGTPNLNPSGDKKVNCIWTVKFEDGSIATVYDWKTKEAPKEIYNWQIGGASLDVLDKMEKILGIETIGTPF
jgi:hypothetical protein